MENLERRDVHRRRKKKGDLQNKVSTLYREYMESEELGKEGEHGFSRILYEPAQELTFEANRSSSRPPQPEEAASQRTPAMIGTLQ